MMLKILFFCLCVLNLLVSGNTLSLIPIQTCPGNCKCNQNCHQTIQNPTNIPFVQQNPIQNVPATIIQPNNNQLYAQGYMPQNQVAFQNQAVDPIANQLSQIYMNKILSNPTVQNILEPIQMYSQLGSDVAQNINKIPNNIPNIVPNNNLPNSNGNAPIINNYYIVPPEFFENLHLKGTQNSQTPMIERETNRRPNRSRRPQPNSAERIPPENRRRQPMNSEGGRRDCPRKSRVRNEMEHSGENRVRYARRRRPDERQGSYEQDRGRITPPGQNPPKELRQHHQDSERQKQHVEQKSDLVVNRKTQPGSAETVRQKPNSSERSGERRKNTRKSKDDAIIADFHKKFPGIPEDVVRKLLSYLRRQLQKQHTENHPFHYPGMNFPLRFDQLFPHLNSQNHRRPNRKPTRKPKTKSTARPRNSIQTTTNVESLTNPTTTEANKVSKPAPKKEVREPLKIQPKEPVTPTPEPTQDTTTESIMSTIPELGTEDIIEDISNNIFPDYYPEFTKDRQYYESDEVYNVRNLRDDRYYYTTDRNYESKPSMHEYNMRKLKTIHKKLEDSYEDVLIKPDTYSSEYDSEKVEYRTPPLLEAPDFKTKQLVRHKPDHNVKEVDNRLSYKASTYSDAKSPTNEEKILKNKKNKPDNIETVYAHSKVVKYGKNNDESVEDATPIVTYYLPDNMQYEEDGKTIIIAKSIPPGHFW